MQLKKMHKVVNALLSYFPPDAEVWLDDENIMVVVDGKKHLYDPDDVLELTHDSQINWEGISKVKAWTKAGKKRIYFKCVGVPEGAHRNGKVFLELINGEWVPNMRYKLMVEFANQLNDAHIFDPQEVENKYKEFLENN